MSYSQAIEEQVRLRHYLDRENYQRLFRGIHYGTMSQYNDLLMAGKVDAIDLPETEWERTTRRQLDDGETYFWAPEICDLVQAVSCSMPSWALTPERLPTRDGFAWLAKRVSGLSLANGGAVQAIGWCFDHHPDPLDLTVRRNQGIAITTWVKLDDANSLVPYHNMDWFFGESFDEVSQRYEYETKNRVGVIETEERKINTLRLIASMFAFLEQRILIAPSRQADRATRRRLDRDSIPHEPLIRVVELRRKQARSEHHGGSDPVEWSHQWIVSGHWRQQWYPSLNTNQPRWIMPYVKGPSDRPLKPPRAKVFAVIR